MLLFRLILKKGMGDDPDLSLIKKINRGNRHAFGVLIDRHQDFVYTIVFRVVKSKEDAEEITQDVFLKIYEALPTFKMESKFTTWLYTIAYRSAISKLRKRTAVELSISETELEYQWSDPSENPLGQLEKQDRMERIKKAINTLGSNESVVLSLYYLKDLKIKEIAAITGISESNIKVHLHRGRKNLYHAMQDQKQLT